MSEWAETTLGDHLTRVRRKVSLQDGAKYAAVSVLKDGQGLGQKEPFVGGVTNYATLYLVHENDVVLRTITAFESPVGVAQATHAATHVSGVFLTYEVGPSMLPGYLRLFFQSPRLWKEMQLRARGTVLRRKTISDANFRAILVPTPSPAEQRRIVDVMAAVDAHIDALKSELDTAYKFCSIRRDGLLKTPEGKQETRLGEVIEVHHGWAFPSSGCRKPLDDGHPRLIRIGDFARNRRSHFIPERSEEFVADFPEKFLLSEGDLLVVMTCQTPDGSILGWPMRVPASSLYLHNQRIGRVEVTKPGNIDIQYAYQLFRSDLLNKALAVTAAGTKVLHTSPKKIYEIPVYLPTLEEQERISAELEAIGANARQCELELSHLRKFRASLLTALLNQEIEIPESYDALLEGAS